MYGQDRRRPFRQEMTADSRKVHQPGLDGVDDQFRGLVNVESVHDIGAMYGDGIGAEVQSVRDFACSICHRTIICSTSSSRGVRPAYARLSALPRRSDLGMKTDFPGRRRDSDRRRQVEIERAFEHHILRAPASIACRTQRLLRMHAEHQDGSFREFSMMARVACRPFMPGARNP